MGIDRRGSPRGKTAGGNCRTPPRGQIPRDHAVEVLNALSRWGKGRRAIPEVIDFNQAKTAAMAKVGHQSGIEAGWKGRCYRSLPTLTRPETCTGALRC